MVYTTTNTWFAAIAGGNTLTLQDGRSAGYSVVLRDNTALTSLTGLAGVSAILGYGLEGRARIHINSGNSRLCYLSFVDWSAMLTKSFARYIDLPASEPASCSRAW